MRYLILILILFCAVPVWAQRIGLGTLAQESLSYNTTLVDTYIPQYNAALDAFIMVPINTIASSNIYGAGLAHKIAYWITPSGLSYSPLEIYSITRTANYVTTTYMPYAGGTFTGSITTTAGKPFYTNSLMPVSGQDIDVTGNLEVSNNITITSDDTHDPALYFVTTNTAHQISVTLDESVGTDLLEIAGTAGRDTLVHVHAMTGENAILGLVSEDDLVAKGQIVMGSGGTLSIQNKIQDKDIRFYVDDGGVTKNIQWDASTDQLKHSHGTFDFHDDNLLTTGNITGVLTNVTEGFLGKTVDDTELTAEDFGDFTSDGGEDGCTLDANVVANSEMADNAIGPDEMADGDHGDFTYTSGVARLTGITNTFDDADSNFTATLFGDAISELDDDSGGSAPNQADYKVNWNQVGNMPAGFADGVDGGGAGKVSVPSSSFLSETYLSQITTTCPTGATLPANPDIGQWFLHAPTGRTILYCYNGSDWQDSAIQGFGNMAVYVDKTDGTDGMAYGTAADGSAFATIQYAVDMVPGLVGGYVTVTINTETYDENVVIEGKNFTGNYEILLQGTMVDSGHGALTASGGSAGSGATKGYVDDSGETFGTSDELVGMILEFASGTTTAALRGLRRVIFSHTDTRITLVGILWAAPVSGDTYTVKDWGTHIHATSGDESLLVQNGQVGIRCDSIYFDRPDTNCVKVQKGASVNFDYCKLQNRLNMDLQAAVVLNGCFVTDSANVDGVLAKGNSTLDIERCYFLRNSSNASGVFASRGTAVTLARQASIDGYTNAFGGMRIEGNSVCRVFSNRAWIGNCTLGIGVIAGGIYIDNAKTTFSGNTADFTAGTSDPAFYDP